MFTALWSPKGGSGTTVTAAGLALTRGHALVDVAGDLSSLLGAPPNALGVTDWLRADAVDSDAWQRLAIATGDISFTPFGTHPQADCLSSLFDALSTPTVFDCGNATSPLARDVRDRADERLLVIRNCYVGLAKASAHAQFATGVVLLCESWRSLSAKDAVEILGVPVVAQIPFDPTIARAADAGTLVDKLPKALDRALRPLVEAAAA